MKILELLAISFLTGVGAGIVALLVLGFLHSLNYVSSMDAIAGIVGAAVGAFVGVYVSLMMAFYGNPNRTD